MNNQDEQQAIQPEAPESFPPELLRQPPGARQEYFEQRLYLSMILGTNFSSESGPEIPLSVSLLIRFGVLPRIWGTQLD